MPDEAGLDRINTIPNICVILIHRPGIIMKTLYMDQNYSEQDHDQGGLTVRVSLQIDTEL